MCIALARIVSQCYTLNPKRAFMDSSSICSNATLNECWKNKAIDCSSLSSDTIKDYLVFHDNIPCMCSSIWCSTSSRSVEQTDSEENHTKTVMWLNLFVESIIKDSLMAVPIMKLFLHNTSKRQSHHMGHKDKDQTKRILSLYMIYKESARASQLCNLFFISEAT